MNAAKIRLSPKELELVTQPGWILTKNGIIEKAIMLMASVQAKQDEHLRSYTNKLPPEITNSTPKISRGEKYLGLPYVMLDYPRLFGKKDVFAIRTLFWWGNFFSVTLQLAGSFKKISGEKIGNSYQMLAERGIYYCTGDKQWEHDLSTGNYSRVADLDEEDFQNTIREKDFVKLVARIPLERWDDAEELLLDAFSQMVSWIS
ncbi:MAG: hypothetical protein ABIT05_06945 [Chitinophagaceae bacterium]